MDKTDLPGIQVHGTLAERVESVIRTLDRAAALNREDAARLDYRAGRFAQGSAYAYALAAKWLREILTEGEGE